MQPASSFSPITPQQSTIFVIGEILPNDDVKFRAVATPVNATVVLDSPGGDVSAGINIGEHIQRKQYETVASNICTSACALIWLSGKTTSRFSNASIGFHAAGWADTGIASGLWSAMEGAYLTRLGFSYSAIRFFTETPPNRLQWLTPERARQFGITIHVYSAPPRPVLGY